MYYSLRITPSEFNCSMPVCLLIVKALIRDKKNVDQDMYITALEKTDKKGRPTKEHIHFNFIDERKKDTLQTWIRRYFADREYLCKGNKCYALSSYDEPDDITRWLRYCMKENWILELTHLKEFSPDEIKNMEMLAKDERSRQIEVNLKREEKQNQKETLYDRICKYLEKNADKIPQTYRGLYTAIVKYYLTDCSTLCARTVNGVTYKYMLTHDLLTIDQYFEKFADK